MQFKFTIQFIHEMNWIEFVIQFICLGLQYFLELIEII